MVHVWGVPCPTQLRASTVPTTWRSIDSGSGAGPGERQATKPSGRTRTAPPRVTPWARAQSVSSSSGFRSAPGDPPTRYDFSGTRIPAATPAAASCQPVGWAASLSRTRESS